mgnify:CR=1 FL=1
MPDSLLSLVDSIYAAASSSTAWPTVAHDIQSVIGGHSVNLALEDTTRPLFHFFYTNGATSDEIQHYKKHLIHRDQFGSAFNLMTPGQSVLSQNLWSHHQLQELFPYECFYKGLGYTYFNSTLFHRNSRQQGWLSVVRSRRDTPFSDEDLLLMQTITPHIRRAFSLNLQLTEAKLNNRITLEGLEHLSAGVIIISRDGKIHHHNSAAGRYISAWSCANENSRVRLPDAFANKELQRQIGNLLSGHLHTPPPAIPFSDGNKHLTALCFPWISDEIESGWAINHTACIVFILGDKSLPPSDRLKIEFGFSRSECNVLHQLLAGHRTGEISDILFVSEATIRFHIRNLLRKTHSKGQSDLIIKILMRTSSFIT